MRDIFPAICVFIAWNISLLGWGSLLARLCPQTRGKPSLSQWLATRLIFSTIFAVACVVMGGHLGFLGYPARWLWWGILAHGILMLYVVERKNLAALSIRSLTDRNILVKIMLAIFTLYFSTRFVTALFPQALGDPLLYHLVGPRLWVEGGSIRLVPNLPNALLASYWEYLYVWCQQLWIGKERGSGLIPAHLMSQWIHLFWGMGGSALLLYKILHRPIEERWIRLIAVFGAITVGSLQGMSSVAKNDWGVIFWIFSGIFFLEHFRERKERIYIFCAGLVWGLALASKLNAALVVLPAFLCYGSACISQQKRSGRALLLVCLVLPLVMLLTTLPIFLRNWLFTENPFFPVFQNIFPSPWVSESWLQLIGLSQPQHANLGLHSLLFRLREFAPQGGGLWCLSLLPLALMRREWRIHVWKLRMPFSIGLIAFVGFSFSVEGSQELRYLGAALVLLAAASVALVLLVVESMAYAQWTKITALLMLILLLATSRMPLHIFHKLPKLAWGEKAILEHTAGDAKAWLRANAKREDLIIFVADNETYYLLGWNITILTERPDIDRATLHTNSLAEFVRALCLAAGDSKFLLDARPHLGMLLRFPQNAAILDRATVYRGVSSRVIDVQKLEAIILTDRKQWHCQAPVNPSL